MKPTEELRKLYGSRVSFVLVYVVDPHPLHPDPSPYSGAVWEFGYSKFRQARTFGERLDYANNVSTLGVFDEVLADGLQTTAPTASSSSLLKMNNPLWCSWGPAPNAAWIIGKDGSVVLAQTWFEVPSLPTRISREWGASKPCAWPRPAAAMVSRQLLAFTLLRVLTNSQQPSHIHSFRRRSSTRHSNAFSARPATRNTLSLHQDVMLGKPSRIRRNPSLRSDVAMTAVALLHWEILWWRTPEASSRERVGWWALAS